MNNIKGTFELIGGTSPGLSTGDLVVIGAAVLSLIGVLISAILTNRMTKMINENNNRLASTGINLTEP